MERRRLRLLVILSAALAVSAPASAQVAMTLNQTAFHPGEAVEVTVAVRNDGPAFSADAYVGTLLPDGTAVFLTSLSPPIGVGATPGGNPGSFPTLLTDVIVPEGLEATIPDFLSLPFSDRQPRGEYAVFVVLARGGSLQDGRIDPGDLVASAVQLFTFADLGTGLNTATIEVSPASPTISDTISVRLSGVWPDSCVPRDPLVRITGSEVRIDTVAAPPDAACLQVLSPWELTVAVGQRPAGTYRVVVIHSSPNEWLELGRAAFDVR